MSWVPKGKPGECQACHEPIEYWADDDGIWAECACSAGYLE